MYTSQVTVLKDELRRRAERVEGGSDPAGVLPLLLPPHSFHVGREGR